MLCLRQSLFAVVGRHVKCAPTPALTNCAAAYRNYRGCASFDGVRGRTTQQRQPRGTAWGAQALEHSMDGSTKYTLILYTKHECPLCEGLQQKLEAVVERAQFLPSVLSNARVEVRDIATNPLWEDEYNMSVPVLVRAEVDGSNEIVLPRPSPRLNADGLQKHLEKVLGEDRWW